MGIILSHYKDSFFHESGFNGMSAKGFGRWTRGPAENVTQRANDQAFLG